MFILVFRPHQRPAWAESYESEGDLVRDFVAGYFARSCHAECTAEDDDEMDTRNASERYALAFDRVAHDLNSLTRLDSANEVRRYLNERDYCGHHNKGTGSVDCVASEIGWLTATDETEGEDEDEDE